MSYKKRGEFNVIGLSVLSVFLLLGTFTLFPDTLASAEDEASNELVDTTRLSADITAPSDVQGTTQGDAETGSTDKGNVDRSIETAIKVEASLSEDVTKDVSQENNDTTSNTGSNTESIEKDATIQEELDPTDEQEAVVIDNDISNPEDIIQEDILVDESNTTTDSTEQEDVDNTEQEIVVPPVSDEKQDVIIYNQNDYVDLFNSQDMLVHKIPILTQEDLFEMEPDHIIDHYVVDDGRIAVTTTVQGVFLRVKLHQPAFQQ